MSKKVIECEYCHTLISEEDTKCPSCGANCSNAIKKYRKEQEEKMKAERDRAMKVVGDAAEAGLKGFKWSMIIIAIPFVLILLMIVIFTITSSTRHSDNKTNEPKLPVVEKEKEKEQEVVTVGYQEEAVTKDLKVTLSSYEFYAYHSDNFTNYNTPEGYQKVAFHFEIENLTDRDVYLWSDEITLSADDYEVKDTDLDAPDSHFASVVQGKATYEDISRGTIKANSKLKGYVGYLVPKDKEKLKFTIGKYITIEMDNPTHNG